MGNIYTLPVPFKSIKYASYHESPYHIGALKHSIDFVVPEGTPVFAACDGIIVDFKLDSNRGGAGPEFENDGNFIEIRHANDEYSEYEHLMPLSFCVMCGNDEKNIHLGKKVKDGDIIGYSGATGTLATLGPHLHFMVGKYSYQTIPIQFHESSNPSKVLKEEAFS